MGLSLRFPRKILYWYFKWSFVCLTDLNRHLPYGKTSEHNHIYCQKCDIHTNQLMNMNRTSKQTVCWDFTLPPFSQLLESRLISKFVFWNPYKETVGLFSMKNNFIYLQNFNWTRVCIVSRHHSELFELKVKRGKS